MNLENAIKTATEEQLRETLIEIFNTVKIALEVYDTGAFETDTRYAAGFHAVAYDVYEKFDILETDDTTHKLNKSEQNETELNTTSDASELTQDDATYEMSTTCMHMYANFTRTGTLTELIDVIEADAVVNVHLDYPMLMVSLLAKDSVARELGVESGTEFWSLFDGSRYIEKPKITVDLVKQFAEYVYERQVYIKPIGPAV